jgi:hypothetical protein
MSEWDDERVSAEEGHFEYYHLSKSFSGKNPSARETAPHEHHSLAQTFKPSNQLPLDYF